MWLPPFSTLVSRCKMSIPRNVRLLPWHRRSLQDLWNRTQTDHVKYVWKFFQVSFAWITEIFFKHLVIMIGKYEKEIKMLLFFRYNSGGKKFTKIHTKSLTVTIDAFTIHNALWLGKKAKLPDKRDMALVV